MAARVPIYNGGQVDQRPVPGARLGVRASQDAFGAATARGAMDVATTAQGIWERERVKAIETKLADKQRRLGEWENAKLHDPKTGAFNKRGKDAFGLPTEVGADFDTFAGELAKDATSDLEREQLAQMVDQRRVSVQRSVAHHVSGEIRKYDDEATAGLVSTSRSSAVANFTDRRRVQEEAERQRDAIGKHGLRNGMPPEFIRDNQRRATSETYAGVIGRMIDAGDDLTAKDMRDQWSSAMTGEDVARIDAALKVGSTRGESQRLADEITAGDVSMADALEKARAIKDPEVRDATEDRVRSFYSVREEARNQFQNQSMAAADKQLVAHGGDFTKIDPTLIAGMDASRLGALEAKAGFLRGENRPNNSLKWMAFLDTAPGELAKMTPEDMETRYRAHLDNQHFERAMAEWGEVKQAVKANKASGYTATRSFDEIVTRSLRDAKVINPDPRKSRSELSRRHADLYVQFEDLAQRSLASFEASKGGKATPDEIEKVVGDLLVNKVMVEEWGFDNSLPVGLVTAEDYGRMYVPIEQVPQTDRSEIQNLMKSRGKTVSDDKVQRAYAAYLAGQRELFNQIVEE